MGGPSMGIPTLSVEEINKKISDLKTVASWLELNMNMLRATIQTLEVQSATLSTLQAMGAILTPDASAAASSAAPAANPFGFPGWPMSEPSSDKPAASQSAPAAEPEPRVEDNLDEDEPEGNEPPAEAASAPPVADTIGATPDMQAAMVNPNAWWNLLQEQFQQAVGNVLADQPGAADVAKPNKPARKTMDNGNIDGKAQAPKKTTKAKAAAKPRTPAKSPVVQSAPSKPVSRKAKSP